MGNLSIFCMGFLLVLAYGVGDAIRFNIQYFEPIEEERGAAQSIAFLARIVLAGAYFISVTYYLQLLAAFLANALGVSGSHLTAGITSVLLVLIGGVGMWRGLEMLESVEKYAVALNLGMIAAMLVALAVYNASLVFSAKWALPNVSSTINYHDFRVLLGLLIIVQGFETSRYLGEDHTPETRISTMRFAQLISSVIYLAFIGLVTVLFHDGLGNDVTAIVALTKPVAVVLPICISITAIGSQFRLRLPTTKEQAG